MPTITLNDRNIKAKEINLDGKSLKLPPAEGIVELWDTVTPGLALRVMAGGKRSYCVTTRRAGHVTTGGKPLQIRRTIGSTETLTLAEARDAAREVLREAARGQDPKSREERRRTAERERREAERAEKNSFRAVAEAYLADPGKGGGAKLRSKAELKRKLEKDIFPKWGNQPIPEITHDDVNDLIKDIAKDRPIAANRTLALLRRVFVWAIRNKKLVVSPAYGIEAPAEETSRDRTLEDWEIARLWPALDNLGHPFGPVFKLLLLTGQRRNEVGGMKRAEINGDMWSIPKERTKNKRPHLVPLVAPAKAIIEALPTIDGAEHVFSSGRARTRDEGGERETDRPVSGWGRVKERIDALIIETAAKAAGEKPDPKKHGLAHWTYHDFRRTMVTWMSEHDVEPHVVEAIVNHVTGAAKQGVAGVYNRATYLPQRRVALAEWAAHIEAVTTGKKPAAAPEPGRNVVSFAGERVAAKV